MGGKILGKLALVAGLLAAVTVHADGSELASAPVRTAGGAASASFDGVVEAVRQTAVAAQVSGAVVAITVSEGDRVKAGQVLVRIDARAAEQSLEASEAEVQSARAALEVATRDFDRQKQLFEKSFTSRAALDRAEAQFKATQAQVAAQFAQAGAVRTQSGFFVVRAPYAGTVAHVPVMPGDMALPGRTLLTLYDPAAMRVSASLPESVAPAGGAIRVEIPALPAERAWISPARVELLPTADPGTHTVQLRVDLPPLGDAVRPGMFARVWLPAAAGGPARLLVPASAIVRRSEMTGLYVLDPEGRPRLRQVRLGRAVGEDVEILAGVSAGERVALDPQAAARLR